MDAKRKIVVNEIEITVGERNHQDYISLTDMARFKDPDRTNYVIQNWLRTRNALEFCGLWEKLHNPMFKGIEFDAFKMEAGSNGFVLTPQRWIKETRAIGIISKSGRFGGGTFAHKDIAFEFATWLSPAFKLFLITEVQRLKEDESKRLKSEWNFQRTLSKINYRIHTDSIRQNLIPETLNARQISKLYANEADLLNVALYGLTAREWSELHPDHKGNARDHSTLEQLIVLSNLESLNAVLIDQGVTASERLLQLNRIAIVQMESLLRNTQVKQLMDETRVEEERPHYGVAS